MPQTVKLPNGDTIRFPDDLSEDDILGVITNNFPDLPQKPPQRPPGLSGSPETSQTQTPVLPQPGQQNAPLVQPTAPVQPQIQRSPENQAKWDVLEAQKQAVRQEPAGMLQGLGAYAEETIGNTWKAMQRGWLNAETSRALEAGDLALLAESQGKIQKLPASEAYEKFSNADTFGKGIRMFLSDPIGIGAELTADSMSGLIPQLMRKAPSRVVVGAGAGAAIGGTAGAGIGAIPGALIGAGAGMMEATGRASYDLEYAGKFLEELGKAGIDVTDKASLEKAFKNPELIAKAHSLAHAKALVIGMTDTASAILGGRIITQPAKSILGKIGQGALETAVQGAAGGLGEYGGQKAAREKTQPGAILGEILGETVTSGPEIGLGAAVEKVKLQNQAAKIKAFDDWMNKAMQENPALAEAVKFLMEQEKEAPQDESTNAQIERKINEDLAANQKADQEATNAETETPKNETITPETETVPAKTETVPGETETPPAADTGTPGNAPAADVVEPVTVDPKKVVYHGSRSEKPLTELKPGKDGFIYFSATQESADAYRKANEKSSPEGIYSGNLTLNNPKVYRGWIDEEFNAFTQRNIKLDPDQDGAVLLGKDTETGEIFQDQFAIKDPSQFKMSPPAAKPASPAQIEQPKSPVAEVAPKRQASVIKNLTKRLDNPSWKEKQPGFNKGASLAWQLYLHGLEISRRNWIPEADRVAYWKQLLPKIADLAKTRNISFTEIVSQFNSDFQRESAEKPFSPEVQSEILAAFAEKPTKAPEETPTTSVEVVPKNAETPTKPQEKTPTTSVEVDPKDKESPKADPFQQVYDAIQKQGVEVTVTDAVTGEEETVTLQGKKGQEAVRKMKSALEQLRMIRNCLNQ